MIAATAARSAPPTARPRPSTRIACAARAAAAVAAAADHGVAGPAAAATSRRFGNRYTTRRNHMMGIEWLKPGVFFGSMLYAFIGVGVFWVCFIVVDKITPYN